jgi:type II secretion system protein G
MGLVHYHKMKKGFTLIELLVVISIIGILIALSMFGLQGAREASRDTKRKSDLEAIRSAIELYKADCNTYPTTPPDEGESLLGPGLPTCNSTETYLEKWPSDPLPATRNYYYSSNGTTYVVCAALEKSTGTVPSGCAAGGCGDDADCSYSVRNP